MFVSGQICLFCAKNCTYPRRPVPFVELKRHKFDLIQKLCKIYMDYVSESPPSLFVRICNIYIHFKFENVESSLLILKAIYPRL